MIFTLETLQARHGDSLILHYGPTDAPRFIVIDGGPARVYDSWLRPRLMEIKEYWNPGKPLPLSMVMISHMDDDHVNGVLDLTRELRDAHDAAEPKEFEIEHIWFNAFDDIVGNQQVPRLAGLTSTASVANLLAAVPELATNPHHINAVLTSTGQGRTLRDDIELLGIPVNEPFDPIEPGKPPLVRGDIDLSVIDWGDGLTLRVLHPDHQRLLKMQEKWDKDLKKAKDSGDNSVIVAAFKDKSPFNLASIVVLAELGGKRILLTGDARGDDILEGLEAAGRLDDQGRIHVDILKLPHHGSDRNVSREFFEKVTADHYVISGNGEHHNPDTPTLVMLSVATRGRDDFTIHLTNHDGKHNLRAELDDFIQADRARGRTYGFEFRADDALSFKIDLADDAVEY